MNDIKIKWKVASVPVGQFRSFERRGWPCSYFENGDCCGHIYCEDDYNPRSVKTGEHGELKIMMADYSQKPWKNVVMKKRCKTLLEAKDFVLWLVNNDPRFVPESLRKENNV